MSAGAGDSVTEGSAAHIGIGKSTLGQRIVLRDRAQAGDLFATTVVPGPSASYSSLLPFASPPTPPPIVAFTAGTTPITVTAPVTLAAGNFGQVTVNSTLTLSGGTYQLQSLTLGTNAVVQATTASIVRIAGKVSAATANFVRIGPTGSQPAGNFRLIVAGGTDAAGGVKLGTDAVVTALVVSRASFVAGDRFAGKGAFAASNVTVGNDASMTFQTGFECNADAACSDGNPCTADACLDARCVHTALPNGTTCPDDGNVCTSDSCLGGACTHPVLPNGTDCTSDNNECTTDVCTTGTCTHPAAAAGTACTDDGNPCTSDSCAGAACAHPIVADGTLCIADGDGTANDECLSGTCTHRSVVPFVNCIAELGPGTHAVLFGYETFGSSSVTLPVGPRNSTAPNVPSAQPPIIFDPGRNPRAFWAPLSGDSLAWTLDGVTATATVASARCGVEAYPPSTPGVPGVHGESHSPPGPSTPKPAPYFSEGQDVAPSAATLNDVRALDVIGQYYAPLTVTVTSVSLGTDQCLRTRDVDAQMEFDRVDSPVKHVYDDGCVFCADSCDFGDRAVSVPFTFRVSPEETTPSLQVLLWENDNGSDPDPVINSIFLVDNRAGDGGTTCTTGRDGWGMCFKVKTVGIPPDFTEPRVCATFNAAYMDGNLGEDDDGVQVPGAAYRRYPASFASVIVNVAGPLGSSSQFTRLDRDGCVPMGMIPKEDYLFVPNDPDTDASLHLSILFALGDNPVGLQRPDGAGYQILSKHYDNQLWASTDHAGDVPLDQWTSFGVWKVPPPRIDVVLPVLSPVTNLAAELSHLLKVDDLGLLPNDPSTPGNEGTYRVSQGGNACVFLDLAGRRYCESHGSSEELSIGYQLPALDAPTCKTDADCGGGTLCYEAKCDDAGSADCRSGGFGLNDFLPFGGTDVACSPTSKTCFCAQTDDSRWKFVIAHEAGHQAEERGIGRLPDASYTFECPPHMTCTGRMEIAGRADLSDPPLVPDQAPFCSCKYVTSANGLHCLNSIERGGDAQAEGFGQFFASRVWNSQSESDCTFAYYKELIDHSCHGADCTTVDAAGQPGFVTAPPVRVACAAVEKWRNRNCPIDSTMSTEFDWLGFLYNLNAAGSVRSPMPEIFQIYRQACLPPPGPGAPPDPNPPRCQLPTGFAFNVQWEATPPGMEVPVGDTACTQDNDCTAGQVCLVGAVGSVAPCDGGNCTCKLLVPCMNDATCPAKTTCRDDAAGSPAPCSDGSCLCKVSQPCTVDADCNGAQNERCRDDSMGFAPCTDGTCVCIRYPTAGFFDGVERQYAGDDARIRTVLALGDTFGVSKDLSP